MYVCVCVYIYMYIYIERERVIVIVGIVEIVRAGRPCSTFRPYVSMVGRV